MWRGQIYCNSNSKRSRQNEVIVIVIILVLVIVIVIVIVIILVLVIVIVIVIVNQIIDNSLLLVYYTILFSLDYHINLIYVINLRKYV